MEKFREDMISVSGFKQQENTLVTEEQKNKRKTVCYL